MPSMAPCLKGKPKRGQWGAPSWPNLQHLQHGLGRRKTPRCPLCSPPHCLFPPRHGAHGETARARGLAAAKRLPRVVCACGRRAGRSHRCCCNHGSAHPLERRQLAPAHRPDFTRKRSHVYTDATAIPNTAINSTRAMAGVAGCFAINSRENGSSCDSRVCAHSGFCLLSMELL